MPTFTPVYNFALPTVGADLNTWGSLLNANFTALENLLKGTTALTGLLVNGTLTHTGAFAHSAGTFTHSGAFDATFSFPVGGNALIATVENATNNGVAYPLVIRKTASVTPAVGAGVGMNFVVETTNGNNEILGQLEVTATDVGAGTEDGSMTFRLMKNGVLPAVETAILNNDGLTIKGLPALVLANVRRFTSGTGVAFVPTAGTRALVVELTGPGGGGGGVDGQGAGTAGMGGSGGGGAYVRALITNMAQTFSYTLPAGGAGGAAGNNAGTAGSTASFSGSVDGAIGAGGGAGGSGDLAVGSAAGVNGGAGGTPAIGGFLGLVLDAVLGGMGTSNLYLASGNRVVASVAGGSAKAPGHARTQVGANVNGFDAAASAPGCGGGGASVSGVATNYAGGSGSRSDLIVWEYF